MMMKKVCCGYSFTRPNMNKINTENKIKDSISDDN